MTMMLRSAIHRTEDDAASFFVPKHLSVLSASTEEKAVYLDNGKCSGIAHGSPRQPSPIAPTGCHSRHPLAFWRRRPSVVVPLLCHDFNDCRKILWAMVLHTVSPDFADTEMKDQHWPSYCADLSKLGRVSESWWEVWRGN